MKLPGILCCLILMSLPGKAQTIGDYRSAGTVDLSVVLNWEIWDGSAWRPAPLAPDGNISAGQTVRILSGHEWNNAYPAVVPAGTTLIHQGSSGSFTTAAASKVSIEGTYVHHTSSSVSVILGGLALGANSQFIYRGSSALVPAVSFSNRTYINLRIESDSGTLTISLAGFAGGANPLTVQGLFEIEEGVTLNQNTFSGALQLNGDISIKGTININSFSVASGKTMTLGNNTLVTLPAGETLTVNGVLNAGSGILKGRGHLVLNGTLKTAHPYGLGASGTFQHSGNTILASYATICYNGSDPQQLTGRNDYPHLVIEGAGEKTMAGPVEVLGNLVLAGGNVLPGNYDISVSGTTSFIGPGYIKTTGAGVLQLHQVYGMRNFPVGQSRYNPVSVSSSQGLSWRVRVVDSVNNIAGAFPAQKSVRHTWDISPSGNVSTGVSLGFQYNDGDPVQVGNAFLVSEPVQLWNYHNGSWSSASLAINPDGYPGGLRTITFNGITRFSGFALVNVSNPLPIYWTYLRASRKNGVHLEFLPASTEPIMRFDIERSLGVSAFSKLASLPGYAIAGTRKYDFHDPEAPHGALRYRVVAVRASGAAMISPQVFVKEENHRGAWVASGESGGTLLFCGNNFPAGIYRLWIISVDGRSVGSESWRHGGGDLRKPWFGGTLPAGRYVFRWSGPVSGQTSFVSP